MLQFWLQYGYNPEYTCTNYLVTIILNQRSRTSSVGKVDDSESGGPRFESRHGHLKKKKKKKICLCCWTRHFT